MALTDKLTAIGNAIRAKTGGSDLLTLDEMPQEIQSIQTGGSGGDTSSEKYDDIVIGNQPLIEKYETKSSGEIRDYAFYNCGNLKEINLPNITTIGYASFQTTGLEKVVLPNVTYLNGSCFRDCSLLTTIDCHLPLTAMASYCFRDSSLNTLILRGNELSICGSSYVIYRCPIADGTGYIYVPSALLEQYKVATNWTTYANQFRAIEDYPEICGEVS